MLREKLKGCDRLEVYVPPFEGLVYFRTTALEGLLEMLSPTVLDFKCRTRHPPTVKTFLGQCQQLRKVELDTTGIYYSWDWLRQTPVPTVRSFALTHQDWGIRTLMQALTVFPNAVTVKERIPYFPGGNDDVPDNDHIWKWVEVNPIYRYNATRLLPVRYMGQSRRVTLHLGSVPQVQKLTSHLDGMPYLKVITLHLCKELPSDHFEAIRDLILQIGRQKQVKTVDIIRCGTKPGEVGLEESDDRMIGELNRLPDSIERIRYRMEQIRTKRVEGNAVGTGE
jgi:hypothetical protein